MRTPHRLLCGTGLGRPRDGFWGLKEMGGVVGYGGSIPHQQAPPSPSRSRPSLPSPASTITGLGWPEVLEQAAIWL